jgi:hypothetical protein
VNGKGVPDASLLLTNDRFFAVKGLPIEEGREVRPLTDALVDYVLLLRLLERSIPEGTGGLQTAKSIDVSEPAKSIEISIPGQGRVGYHMKLAADGQPLKELAGEIEFAPALTSDFQSSLSLAGWKAFKIDRVQLVHAGQQTTEYWPRELSSVATLGDLRAYAGPGN